MKQALTVLVIFGLLGSLVASMQTVEVAEANFLPVASVGHIYSPENKTYTSNLLTLNASVSFFITEPENRWIAYSLDGGENVTLTGTEYSIDLMWKSINITAPLPALSEGSHRLDIYAQFFNPINFSTPDSRTVFFTIDTTMSTPPALSPTKTPTPSPTQSPVELPWAAGNFTPIPNSTDIPLNTTISISFGRPPSICSLTIIPTVAINERVFKAEGYGGTYIFYLAEPLKPQTTYTVTITYGQETAQEGFKPTSTRTWNFTTETNSPTQTPTLQSTPWPSLTPSNTPEDFTPVIIMIVVVIAVIVAGVLFYSKREKK